MRQRITYLHDQSQAFSADQIKIANDSVSLISLQAAKEHRITFGLSELPIEVILKSSMNDLPLRR